MSVRCSWLFVVAAAPLAFVGHPAAAEPTPVPNRAPVIAPGSFSGPEDDALAGRLEASDEDGDELRFTVKRGPRRGELQLAEDGTFSYRPQADFHGKDPFTVEVSDGKAKAAGEVSLEVTPVNDAPVAEALSLQTLEDQAVRGQVKAADVDGDALVYRVVKQPASGAVELHEGTGKLVYTPAADFHGEDGFVAEVLDGALSARAKVSLAIAPVNDAPVMGASSARGPEDTALRGRVDASDVDGDDLSFRLVKGPRSGAVELEEKTGTFRYRPKADFHGKDAFTVEVSDGQARVAGEVSLELTPVNDAPVAEALSLQTLEDQAVRGQVKGTDVDGDALVYRVTRQPGSGAVELEEKTGALVYTPAADFHGVDGFVLEVSDGALSATAEVSAAIASVNDAPVAGASSARGAEDTELQGRVSASDVDGDTLTFRMLKGPRSGAVDLEEKTGAFRYRPKGDFHGKDAFTVEVSDGKAKVAGEVSLEVTPVNDPPSVEGLSLRTPEDQGARGQVKAADVDGDALSYRVAKQPASGAVELDEKTGALVYTPAADFHGEDGFLLEVSDGTVSAAAQVSVAIAPVNDAPAVGASSARGAEDTELPGRVSASDVDGDTLTFRVLKSPRSGAVDLDEKTGAFRYRPKGDFHGKDAFTVEVSDGTAKAAGEVSLQVTPVNDAPVTEDLAVSGLEDEPLPARVAASDVDGDPLVFSLKERPRHGEVELEEKTGAFTYRPSRDYHGEDRFLVHVSDGKKSAAATVRLTLAAVNDPPVAEGGRRSGDEDKERRGRLVASDVDGDPLRFRLRTAPRHGELKLDEASGDFSFQPKRDFHGQDAFAFEVSDGKLKAVAELALVVTPVNDAPVAQDMVLTTAEDKSVSGKLSASDVDGDSLRFSLDRRPANGEAVVDEASGVVRYTPAPDFHGDDALTVAVTDGEARVSAGVTLTVTPVPDAPRVSAQLLELNEDEELVHTLVAEDPDGDALTFRLLSEPSLGVAVLEDPAAGRVRFTPAPDVHGEEELHFEVTDGRFPVKGSARVRVRPVNDAPTVASLQLVTQEETPVTGTLQGKDADGDELVFRIEKPPKRGRASFDEQGRLRFVPAQDQTGTVRFTVVADDGQDRSEPAQVVVQVKNINDAPVAKALRFDIKEDVVLDERLVGHDPDGDELLFEIVERTRRGEVVLMDPATGAFRYSPRKDLSGFDSFTFLVSDGELRSAAATVRLHIEAVNDPPVGMRDYLDAPRLGRVTRRLQASDPEGDGLRFRISRQPALGKVELLDAATGEFIFTSDGRGRGQATFQFIVNDGELDSSPVDMTVNVR